MSLEIQGMGTAERTAHGFPTLSVSVVDAARAAGVGRTTIYEAIAAGELRSIKVGRRRLIRVDALRAWLASKELGA